MEASELVKVLTNTIEGTHSISQLEIIGELICKLPAMNKSIYFKECTFHNLIQISQNENSRDLNIEFDQCTFKSLVTISARGGKVALLNKTKVENGFEVNSRGEININFSGCILKGQINFTGGYHEFALINTFFNDASTNDSFNLNSESIGVFRLLKCSLVNSFFKIKISANAIVENTDFRVPGTDFITDFSFCRFERGADFINANFEHGVNFSNSIFSAESSFYGANKLMIGDCDFSDSVFTKPVDFDSSKWRKGIFSYADFKDFVSFKNSSFKYFQLTKANINKIDFWGIEIEDSDRETFRLIKNEFRTINNQIEAIKYKRKEMIAYEKELRKSGNFSEYFLVFLNKISNSHGVSWGRGVIFTVLFGVLFYTFYLFTLGRMPFNWGWINWSSFTQAADKVIGFFVKFFLVTHDLDFMKEFKPSAGSYILDFISRIFVGFGIYQTIAAFRKHGKN